MSADEPKPYVSKIDRRTALAWVGAVGAAAAVGAGVVVYERQSHGQPKPVAEETPVDGGYGTDPNLLHPAKAPWPRLLSPDELQAAAVLADFILPATSSAPAATALGIPDFIDEWVSAPYPDQLKDRPILREGLQALVPALVKGDAGKRQAALSALPGATDEKTKAFFKRFRALTVGAYYTTEAGFKDIGYIGNEARPSDPGPSDAAKAHVRAALGKLGLRETA